MCIRDSDEVPRDEALENAREEASSLAVAAGAIPGTVAIIDVEAVPLAYYPGNTSRLKDVYKRQFIFSEVVSRLPARP